jgi:hypothetical protein
MVDNKTVLEVIPRLQNNFELTRDQNTEEHLKTKAQVSGSSSPRRKLHTVSQVQTYHRFLGRELSPTLTVS